MWVEIAREIPHLGHFSQSVTVILDYAIIRGFGGSMRYNKGPHFCGGFTVRIIAARAGMSEMNTGLLRGGTSQEGAAPNRHRPTSTNRQEETEMDQTELNEFGNRY